MRLDICGRVLMSYGDFVDLLALEPNQMLRNLTGLMEKQNASAGMQPLKIGRTLNSGESSQASSGTFTLLHT